MVQTSAEHLFGVLYPGDCTPQWNPQCGLNQVCSVCAPVCAHHGEYGVFRVNFTTFIVDKSTEIYTVWREIFEGLIFIDLVTPS